MLYTYIQIHLYTLIPTPYIEIAPAIGAAWKAKLKAITARLFAVGAEKSAPLPPPYQLHKQGA